MSRDPTSRWARPGERPWTTDEEALLARLWDEDKLSGAEIARQMGRSKNSVVGKARRLSLDRRPSPILPPNPNAPKRRKRARLDEVSDTPHGHWVIPIVAAFEQEAREVLQGPAIGRYAERDLQHETCQWLEGEPAMRAFCGLPVVKGTSWCLAHAKRVFRKAKPIEVTELAELETLLPLFSAPSPTLPSATRAASLRVEPEGDSLGKAASGLAISGRFCR